MVGNEHIVDIDDKSETNYVHVVKHPIPGFCEYSQIRKTTDDNLSPFMSYNSIPIQSGDTPNVLTSTDNPAWFPGECPFLANYEGKFKRKKYTSCSPVIFSVLIDEIYH